MSFEIGHNICIFGMRGSGKSTLCRNIQKYYSNIFIFDTLNEYNHDDGIIFYNYADFSNYVLSTSEKEGLRVIIQFDIENCDNDYFDEFIKLLYYRGDCTLVIEEVQNFASIHKIPPFLKQASLTGRHKNVNFITTTQRIAEIHKSLLSQCHHLFSGYTDSPNDKKTLKEYGFNISDIEFLEQFKFLWKENRDICLINNNLDFVSSTKNHEDLEREIEDEAENIP